MSKIIFQKKKEENYYYLGLRSFPFQMIWMGSTKVKALNSSLNAQKD
jgi:hypothetical protein